MIINPGRGQAVSYEVTLRAIRELLGDDALVAWDRDGMEIPDTVRASGRVVRWNGSGWFQRPDPRTNHRLDGIGCVWVDAYRAVLVHASDDPLGCRWIRADFQ